MVNGLIKSSRKSFVLSQRNILEIKLVMLVLLYQITGWTGVCAT